MQPLHAANEALQLNARHSQGAEQTQHKASEGSQQGLRDIEQPAQLAPVVLQDAAQKPQWAAVAVSGQDNNAVWQPVVPPAAENKLLLIVNTTEGVVQNAEAPASAQPEDVHKAVWQPVLPPAETRSDSEQHAEVAAAAPDQAAEAARLPIAARPATDDHDALRAAAAAEKRVRSANHGQISNPVKCKPKASIPDAKRLEALVDFLMPSPGRAAARDVKALVNSIVSGAEHQHELASAAGEKAKQADQLQHSSPAVPTSRDADAETIYVLLDSLVAAAERELSSSNAAAPSEASEVNTKDTRAVKGNLNCLVTRAQHQHFPAAAAAFSEAPESSTAPDTGCNQAASPLLHTATLSQANSAAAVAADKGSAPDAGTVAQASPKGAALVAVSLAPETASVSQQSADAADTHEISSAQPEASNPAADAIYDHAGFDDSAPVTVPDQEHAGHAAGNRPLIGPETGLKWDSDNLDIVPDEPLLIYDPPNGPRIFAAGVSHLSGSHLYGLAQLTILASQDHHAIYCTGMKFFGLLPNVMPFSDYECVQGEPLVLLFRRSMYEMLREGFACAVRILAVRLKR